jgi:hypothetical protein
VLQNRDCGLHDCFELPPVHGLSKVNDPIAYQSGN